MSRTLCPARMGKLADAKPLIPPAIDLRQMAFATTPFDIF